MVGAGVGALIVSRYPRNLVGWLFLIGQLGNAIGLAADAFRVLVVQGVVDSPVAGQIAGYLGQVFSTIFAVSVMSVIFMIAPDGRLLSRRWRLAIAVPIAALVMWWVGIALLPAGAFVPGAVVELQGFRRNAGRRADQRRLLRDAAVHLARRGGPGPAAAAIHRPATPPAALDSNGRRGSRGDLRGVRAESTLIAGRRRGSCRKRRAWPTSSSR